MSKEEIRKITWGFNIITAIVVLGLWAFVIIYSDFNLKTIMYDSSPFTAGIIVFLIINMIAIKLIKNVDKTRDMAVSLKQIEWGSFFFWFFTIFLIGMVIEGIPNLYPWYWDGVPRGFRSPQWDRVLIIGTVYMIFSSFFKVNRLSGRVEELEEKLI